MQINEITNKPSTRTIFESLSSDKDHTFGSDSLQEIAESVTNFDESDPGMSTSDFLEMLNKA